MTKYNRLLNSHHDLESFGERGKRTERATVMRVLWLAVVLVGAILYSSSVIEAGESPELDLQTKPKNEKAASESFTCTIDTSGSPVCVYYGPVKYVYVNDNHFILLYHSGTLASQIQAEMDAVGFEAYYGQVVGNTSAFAIQIPSEAVRQADPSEFHRKSEFADKAFSLALAAQITDKPVNLQIRGTAGSWLSMDRIWIME